ncbi:hypothetical protein RHSIM_RhsimUnG0181700 [Rhododendron simsii]|uniref:hydroxyethylthiazole kinase n=1 Tax=Rhododendron simsii TaxID=118357 RepID=A0A834FUA9_RHOSS|nr:hypothetical protein RHSIM_RhsimUnG0181700 [Rhododendron simsii]
MVDNTHQVKHQQISPEWGPTAWAHLSTVRAQSPLIQCITNFVSMDLMANTLLSAGASPAMIHSLREIPDFTPCADALCVNVGTLTAEWLPAMRAAVEAAGRAGKPWVLDPVAAGASRFRLEACRELVGMRPTVVRGNGSEILALAYASVGPSKITATGCSVTALIAAFVAIDPLHAFEATATALSIFGIAGEIGMDMAKGPASLRVHLIDSLYGLDQDTVVRRVNIISFA